ncbi:MAG: hypothetical protein ACD_42C00500G0006 [uncultured bacterium]|nr:MAG: hypothetical protein ACD_42C00500G0006 [uncultured bacterium]OGT34610.1 MAG: hypothetical protein A3C44_07270 [Gammaproteobacteria bacterium RIFCSPHIGHO2_02_FULL_39_13]OGT50031.1 MAG: hypothetical protein A3E53_02375 [Gammaproteobacteria bacterium RIFCSPHIGHO2_12_FULL_39_24]
MTRKTHLFPPTPNNNNLALKWTRDEFNDGDLRVLQNGREITTTVPKNIAPFDFPSLPFREIPNIITPLNTLKFNQLVETLAEKKVKVSPLFSLLNLFNRKHQETGTINTNVDMIRRALTQALQARLNKIAMPPH